MRTLLPYLPALTLSLYACAGEPSAPTPAPADAADAGTEGAHTIETSDGVASSNSHASPTSMVTEEPSASPTDDAASTASSPHNSAEFAPSTAPNASEVDATSTPFTTGTPNDEGTEASGDDETPPLSDPIGSRNFACDPSPSPMFESHEVLEMRLAADFSVVNGNDKETATSPGALDPDGAGPLAAIPVEVHARGISRFRDCGYRPFKVKFAEKQKDNVFKKLGKSVKFSTHCGDREGMHEILKAPSLDEYYQRVRMEHLVYQLLAPLQTLSLQTRLVRVTYEDTSTGTEETHLAFVREPEDELAQRCGMVESEDIPDDPSALNERANLLLYLVNNFVIQADVKNRFDVVDVDKQLRAPVPYDFDLLGIFRREYLGLDGRTLAQNAEAFADWLRRNQSSALHEEVKLLLSKREVMRRLVAGAELTTTNRSLFDEWLDSFLGVLETFDTCESSEQDANATACYVPDDHANTLEDAATVTEGEHSLLLEPPGDHDVVRVELESNKLYTVTTSLNAELRAPDGSVVGSLGERSGTNAMAFSLRASTVGVYGLEFDRGSSLVCSDMWNNGPDVLAQPYAVYEDDHGASLELATPLEAGTTTTAHFELTTLQGLFDEDWFTLTVTPDTQVFVESGGADSAFIEIFAAEDPTVAIDTYFLNAQGAREQITALFPAAGSYVLRAIQGWDQATYSIEVVTATE